MVVNKKKACWGFALSALPILILLNNPVYAQVVEHGADYETEYLGETADGKKVIFKTTVGQPNRILDGNQYKDYILTDTIQTVKLETQNAGSIIFDKTTCRYDLYEPGRILNGEPAKIRNIGWSVLGKSNSSSNWSMVNIINNAACSVSVQSTASTVKITAQKQNGAGIFQAVLDYAPGKGIKETMRAYNNNAAWNNHNIGFRESFEVPRFIEFGKNQYDLSSYNGTTLNRNWIENNQAKVMRFLDGGFYDIDLGYEYLENISISYSGVTDRATITMNYLYGGQIVPYQQWVEVDPTFGYTTGTDYTISSTAGATTCDSPYATRADLDIWLRVSGAAADPTCYNRAWRWDITNIPDYADITNVQIRYDITGVSNPKNCEWRTMSVDPGAASTTATAFWNAVLAGNIAAANSSQCTTVANNKVINMGSNGTNYVESQTGKNWISFAATFADRTRTGVSHVVTFSTTEIEITYEFTKTNAVTVISAPDINENDLDLAWTAPDPRGRCCITGYQINFTTPWSTPSTVIVNNTGTNTTGYNVSGLTGNTQYSFRVAAWKEGVSGNNATGTILDVTTAAFTPANFTIGSINVNSTNPSIWPIRFERSDTNSTLSTLEVIYDNTFDMACNFDFVNGRTNKTYYTLTPAIYDSDHNSTTFTFYDYSEDIIQARCWDQSSNETGYYTYQQSDFPLLDQINNFRNGTYGTMGQIGSLDLITVAIIIFSMVGFNRVSESVGAIINIALLGALMYFGIISLPGLILGGVALIIMLAVVTTRKD